MATSKICFLAIIATAFSVAAQAQYMGYPTVQPGGGASPYAQRQDNVNQTQHNYFQQQQQSYQRQADEQRARRLQQERDNQPRKVCNMYGCKVQGF